LFGRWIKSRNLSSQNKLRVFENGVLGKIFGPKKDEVTGEWRRLHNEELYDLYSSPKIIRVIKSRSMIWAKRVERNYAYRVLVGRPEGRPRRRWEHDIKMNFVK
jgi:uncharacterized membrane protein